MKRYIKASLSPSTPDWLRRKLANKGFGNNLKSNMLRKYNIALDKATYTDTRTSSDCMPIYLLRVDYGDVVYIPSVNDDESASINGRYRKLGSIAKSKLSDMAEDIVYIDLSDSNNTYSNKERYQDPRYAYRYAPQGSYAGQYKKKHYNRDTGEYEDAGWSDAGLTPSNERRARDKSGYKVPSPEERLKSYYSKFPERITTKVDKLYANLIDVKDQLMNVDFKGDVDISRAYRYFSDALSDYKDLLNQLEQNKKYNQDNWSISLISNRSQDIKSRLDDVVAILNGEDVW